MVKTGLECLLCILFYANFICTEGLGWQEKGSFFCTWEKFEARVVDNIRDNDVITRANTLPQN